MHEFWSEETLEALRKRDNVVRLNNGLHEEQPKPRTDHETMERAMKRFRNCEDMKSFDAGNGERVWVKKLVEEMAEAYEPEAVRLRECGQAGPKAVVGKATKEGGQFAFKAADQQMKMEKPVASKDEKDDELFGAKGQDRRKLGKKVNKLLADL